MDVETIATPDLGDRSYLVHHGRRALVVDPQRDIDRVLAVARRVGVSVDLVLETHLHNDYVTGGLALAREVGAEYVVAAAEPVDFERRAVLPDERLRVGGLVVRAVAAPGHTLHHLAYVVEEHGRPRAVFTGGSLLYGTVGRTDLDHRTSPEALTRAQYRAVRALVDGLPEDVTVHPTHGFGSFCSSTTPAVRGLSTVGQERRHNLVFAVANEDAFVEEVLNGLTGYPTYYAYMGPRNRRGPTAADLSLPAPIDAAELHRRIAAGEWIVDVRRRRVFAERHISGTIGVELGDYFATYIGWVLPYGLPLTLVGSPEEVAEARRALARIGIDAIAGVATDPVATLAGEGQVRRYPVVDLGEVARRFPAASDVLLDVRRDEEWRQGHVDGALHIPLPQLLFRLAELPRGRRVWVHCGSGFRASVGASILDRSGFDVVLVDDDFGNAGAAGLDIV